MTRANLMSGATIPSRRDEGSIMSDTPFDDGPKGLFTNTRPEVRHIIPKHVKDRTLVRARCG